MKLFKLILIYLILISLNSYGQSRWSKSYYNGIDAIGISIVKSYDKGILLTGKHGHNSVSLCWLTKIDINGEILWEKTIGYYTTNIKISDISYNNYGEIYLVGLTGYYSNNDYDPILIKLNSCGEKEWCKVFFEDGNNFSNALEITSDGDVVMVLRYMNPDLINDRVCLAKISRNGEIIWKNCYNSSDTSLYFGEARDVTICPDKGFLISGSCYYEDTNPPNYLWIKPYYIKTDSLGNFEWETVVYKDEVKPGGIAWSAVVSPDLSYYYSSINHFYYNPDLTAGSLVKLDLEGNVTGVYDIATPNDHGALYQAKFISDTSLMASASWGPESSSVPKAVLIDTLGNIINSEFLLDNTRMAETELTHDGKLLYFTNDIDENDEFDAYLFKLNQQLESDTIYYGQYTYDSLCPYQIENDTIVQDGCGLIVGGVEMTAKPEMEKITIYPNPALTAFTVKCSLFENNNCVIEVMDMLGRKVTQTNNVPGTTSTQIDISSWQNGLYLVRISKKGEVVGSERVVVE